MDELPGIIIALVIIYFLARWFRSPSKPTGGDADTPTSGPLRGVTPQMISTVTSAFPHISPSSIVYSLSKTKSAHATVEQILSPRGLPEPAASFPVHPYLQRLAATPVPSTSTTTTLPTSTTTPDVSSKPTQTLIDRYDLSSAIHPQDKGKGRAAESDLSREGSEAFESGPGSGRQSPAKWETTAEGRQKALNERKQAMVLEARRKLLEKKAAQNGIA